ncbi:MAG TPA: hypothetical protein VIX15_08745 [Streptosporangiaceae bacterium]
MTMNPRLASQVRSARVQARPVQDSAYRGRPAPPSAASSAGGPLSEAGGFAARNLGGEPNRVVARCY